MTWKRNRGRGAALGGALCLYLGACAYEGPSLWTIFDGGSGTSSGGGSGTSSGGGSGTSSGGGSGTSSGGSSGTSSGGGSGTSSDGGSGTDSNGGRGRCGEAGQACCSSGEKCGTALFCQPLSSATATCQASPKTCYEILTCAKYRCNENDATCARSCYLAASTAAQKDFDGLKACSNQYCSSMTDMTDSDFEFCLEEYCFSEAQACGL
jgi:hypothetical protein